MRTLHRGMLLAAALFPFFTEGAQARAVRQRSSLEGVLARADFKGVRSLVRAGRYAEAHEILILRRRKKDPGASLLAERLAKVQKFYPTLDADVGPSEKALHRSIDDFLNGRDRQSVLRAAYALSLPVAAPDLDLFLTDLEDATHLQGERVDPALGMNLLEKKIEESKVLFESGRFAETLSMCEDMLIMVPRYPTALSRKGSSLYLLRRYAEARDAWRRALSVENREDERAALIFMIQRVNRKVGG